METLDISSQKKGDIVHHLITLNKYEHLKNHTYFCYLISIKAYGIVSVGILYF